MMIAIMAFLLVFLLGSPIPVKSFSPLHGRRRCALLIHAGRRPFPLSDDPVFRSDFSKEWNEGRDQSFIPIGPLEGTEIDYALSLRDDSEVKERFVSYACD
jgi:hypothetical protein